jgi:hypothetical protein
LVVYRLAVTLGNIDIHECKCPGLSLCIKAPSQAPGNAMLKAARLTKTEELALDVTMQKGARRDSPAIWDTYPVLLASAERAVRTDDCEPALASHAAGPGGSPLSAWAR